MCLNYSEEMLLLNGATSKKGGLCDLAGTGQKAARGHGARQELPGCPTAVPRMPCGGGRGGAKTETKIKTVGTSRTVTTAGQAQKRLYDISLASHPHRLECCGLRLQWCCRHHRDGFVPPAGAGRRAVGTSETRRVGRALDPRLGL